MRPSSPVSRGSDAPPWSPTSTRTRPPVTETATSNSPPSPDALCLTALAAISLTRSSTSSRPGKPSPSTSATNRRACDTAEATPRETSTGRARPTPGQVAWPEPSQSRQVTRTGSAVPRVSMPRTSARRDRRSFHPRPRHPGQTIALTLALCHAPHDRAWQLGNPSHGELPLW